MQLLICFDHVPVSVASSELNICNVFCGLCAVVASGLISMAFNIIQRASIKQLNAAWKQYGISKNVRVT